MIKHPGNIVQRNPLTKTLIASGVEALDQGATLASSEFRSLGGKVVAFYYGEWRTDGNTNSWNPFPHQWLQQYRDRIPMAAIETYIPRSFDFTLSKTRGWTAGASTTITPSATGIQVSGTNTDPTIFSPTNLGINGNSCRYINVSIKRTGGSGWDGTLYWATVDDDTFDANKKIIISQPAWTGNTLTMRIDAASMTSAYWDLWQQSTIKRLRLDLGNTAADTFEISSFSFVLGRERTMEMALPAEQQWAVDWELAEAKRIGVDVMAVNFYWSAAGANWAGYSLDLMEASTVPKPMHCISWSNHDASVYTQANLDALLAEWNTRFAHANYWKIGGKPVVYVFDLGEFGRCGSAVFHGGLGHEADVPQAQGLKELMDYIKAKPMSNAPLGIHIVMCGRVEHPYWTGRYADWVGRLEYSGVSAASGYSFTDTYLNWSQANAAGFGGAADGTYPAGGVNTFTDLTEAGIRSNSLVAQSGSGIPHWPCVMSGRDSKSWQRMNGSARSNTWNTQPDPSELRRALKDAVAAAVASHKACLPANRLIPVISIYAWNELAEGGYIVPTIGRGYAISNVIRDLLK